MKINVLSPKNRDELNELVDGMTNNSIKMREIRSNLNASGMPMPQLNILVDQYIRDPNINIRKRLSALEDHFQKNGIGHRFNLDKLENIVLELVDLTNALTQQRQVTRSYDVDMFVINKLVEIKCHSPLDGGVPLILELGALVNINFEKASNDSVALDIVQVTNDSCINRENKKKGLTGTTSSLIKKFFADEMKAYRSLFFELILGVLIGIGAINLLS